MWYEISQELGFFARPESVDLGKQFCFALFISPGAAVWSSFKDVSTRLLLFCFNECVSLGLFQEKRDCYNVD